jgi:hypothetical protein
MLATDLTPRYTMLGKAVERINPTYCMLTSKKVSTHPPPARYLAETDIQFVALFLTADVFSLVLQAIGGGWAASVAPSPPAASNLMLAGIAFQLAVMIIFVGIGADFCYRAWKDKPYRNRASKLAPTSSVEMGMVGSESRGTSIAGQKGVGYGANGEAWTGMSRGWWMFMVAMFISSLAIIIRGK